MGTWKSNDEGRTARGFVRRAVSGLALGASIALLAAGCSDGGPEKPSTDAEVIQEAADLVPQSIRDKGELSVGTNVPYAPMGMFADDGVTLTGAEIDLMEGIAARLGLKVKWDNATGTGC